MQSDWTFSKSEHEMSCVGNIGSIYHTFFCVVCELKGRVCYWMIGGVVSRPCAMKAEWYCPLFVGGCGSFTNIGMGILL